MLHLKAMTDFQSRTEGGKVPQMFGADTRRKIHEKIVLNRVKARQ